MGVKLAQKQEAKRRYGSTVTLAEANPVIIVEIANGRDDSAAGRSAALFSAPSATSAGDR